MVLETHEMGEPSGFQICDWLVILILTPVQRFDGNSYRLLGRFLGS